MFSFICARINGWVNNGEAGNLRRHHAHYDVTVIVIHSRYHCPCNVYIFHLLDYPYAEAPQMWYVIMVASLLGFILRICQSETNYALKRYAWQKDIWNNIGLPSRAVDGNTNPWWSGNSCAMCASIRKPWWVVDLGQVIHLSRIVVTNRIDDRKTALFISLRRSDAFRR